MNPLLLCRLGLVAVFGIAGVMKARDIRGFSHDIHLFDLLSWSVSQPLAFVIVALELVTAVALLIPWFRLGAALSAFGMSVVFMVAIGSAWIRGIEVSCGCFGESGDVSNFPLHMAGLAMMAAAGAVLIRRECNVPRDGVRSSGLPGDP